MGGWLADIGVWLGELGFWAYLVAPAVMALVSILPIPAEAPAMANGMLFGPVVGTAMSWTGAMIGAWISYEIALMWGRPAARRMVGAKALAKVDSVAEDAGWWGLIVLRLIPLVAFTALNWGAGFCGIPRWRFLWTTGLGILPGAIVFTSSGVGLQALYRTSPALAVALTCAVIAAGVVWAVRRRNRVSAAESTGQA